ncbi:MAG: CotH kinase family protein [Planctomycetaceae bacterium]
MADLNFEPAKADLLEKPGIQMRLNELIFALAACCMVPSLSVQAQGPGGPGGPNSPDLKLVEKFDKDKDGRLSAAERKPASEWLKEQQANSQRRGGRRRGPGGRGNDQQASPGPKVSPEDVTAVGEDKSLYDASVLRTIFLTFENEKWEEELAMFKPTDVEIEAKMVVDGKTYPNVGVSFRGASSFFRIAAGSKRSLNISTDFVDKDQRLYGIKSLNLLNCNGDASLMSSYLYQDIVSKKIAAPRVNFVKVVINGRSWGVYANAEQFNKDFLKDRYGSKKGARWKVNGSPRGDAGLRYLGDDLEQYRERFDLKSKESEKPWKDLVELCRVLEETPAKDIEEALKPILDVDGALWFLAADVALINSDGYWTRASDYSIYQNEKGVFHILPHDMNEAFRGSRGGGGGGRGGPGGRGPGGGGPGVDGPPGFGPPGGGAPGGGRPGFGPGQGGGPPGGGFGPPPGQQPPQGGGNGLFSVRYVGSNVQQGGRGRGEQRGGQQRGGRGDQREGRGGRGGGRGFGGGGRGFGGGGGGGGMELDPLINIDNPRFPLRSKLLANENLKRRYLEYVELIAKDYLDWGYLGPKVADARKLIEAEVKADTRKLMTLEAFQKATDAKNGSLREFCTKRSEYLLNCPAIKGLAKK